MIIFGLTGSIATGKSNIANCFTANLIPVVDADIISRKVVGPGSVGLRQIITVFGSQYLTSDEAEINRTVFGRFVFSNKDALSKLNEIMWPLIQQEASRQFLELNNEGHALACWSAALIIEAGHARKYNPLIVSHCTREQQIERLVDRGLTQDEAVLRIDAQLPSNYKLQLADFAIDTSGTKEETIIQTEIIIKQLKRANNASRSCL